MENEKSCLVTQDLIGAVKWFMTAPESIIKPEKGGDGKTTWKEKAYDDLCAKIRREKRPFPEAAKRGVDFEKKVYEVATLKKKVGSEFFQAICKEVEGYLFYKKGGLNKEIEGNNCYLYAKYDAIKENEERIKDLKTTQEYKKGKYLKGFQHKLYCYITGATYFQYVIAEWEEHPKLKAVHTEDYYVTDRELLESEVEREIIECFDTLKDLGLWEDYREKYCLY